MIGLGLRVYDDCTRWYVQPREWKLERARTGAAGKILAAPNQLLAVWCTNSLLPSMLPGRTMRRRDITDTGHVLVLVFSEQSIHQPATRIKPAIGVGEEGGGWDLKHDRQLYYVH